MQHINNEQCSKHSRIAAEHSAHLKSGKQFMSKAEERRAKHQLANFKGCVRKSVRKFMS